MKDDYSASVFNSLRNGHKLKASCGTAMGHARNWKRDKGGAIEKSTITRKEREG